MGGVRSGAGAGAGAGGGAGGGCGCGGGAGSAAAGDRRPLHQLRADTALALLVHGNLPLPDVADLADRAGCADRSAEGGAGDDRLLGAQADAVATILGGLPSATVEVIVPLDALLTNQFTTGDADADGGADDPGAGRRACTVDRTRGWISDGGLVAELVGGGFIAPEQARELALTPGSTWHRLVTDPVDGRLRERSIAAYRPDAAMRAQVSARDRSCRGPGCTVPSARCQPDHEQPHAAGGPTAGFNLNDKHGRHHWVKTIQAWASAMDDTAT